MANYYATAISNTFQVKDLHKFVDELQAITTQIAIIIEDEANNKLCLHAASLDENGWPSYIYDEETNDDLEFDIAEFVSKHLVPGSVAVFMETGAEKTRYVNGYAVAINSEGNSIYITLNDIFERAKELGTDINTI